MTGEILSSQDNILGGGTANPYCVPLLDPSCPKENHKGQVEDAGTERQR